MVELDESDGEDLGIVENAPAQRIELAALRRADRSVSQENFRRLDGETWLDKTIIDMFLQAYVNDSCRSAHCMRAHFMAKLLEDNVGNDDYAAEESAKKNFEEVRDWCGNLGISASDVTFVPINVDGSHWIFLRADFRERKISLYDSMGSVDPRNRKFMAAMRRYLYDANFEEVRDWCGNLEISASDVMFVPINVDGSHWIFLRANFRERKIKLYDSMGSVDPRNR